MQFNPFGLGIAQPRPLQQHNAIVPNISMNQGLPAHSVNRMVEQHHETPAQSQKRSSTPVLSSAFTPTAVMRKMTADQQTKSGASIVNAKVTAFTGMSQQMAAPTPSAFSAISASGPHPNPLSSFMSAVAQNQTSHLPIHPQQQQQQNLPQPSHPGHSRPGNVPLPHSGFHPQRIHFPVVVGPPNAGMPGQFPPFMIYPQMPQRK
jgi:hypothetical protein